MFQFWLPVPVATQLALMTLNVVKPVYCVPMFERLKAPVPLPPSWNVSAPAPRTLPWMLKPGPSVSVFVPEANCIAVPPLPMIVPESKMLTLEVPKITIPLAPETVPVLVMPPAKVEML